MRWRAWAILALLLLPGCAARYFEEAGPAPPVVRHELAHWPWQEVWTGIVFNGARIGFSHTELRALEDEPARWEIRAEAGLVLSFLGVEKKVNLRSRDVVRADLGLERFEYDYTLDGSVMRLAGSAGGGRLEVAITTGGETSTQVLSYEGTLHPVSALALLPVLYGLEVGAARSFTVYDGETQRIAELRQTVAGWETSPLFQGAAFKVQSRLHGFETSTWIDRDARPVFELGLNGVMVSALETEAEARRYLAGASLNKQEALLDFSLVRTASPIERPREVDALTVQISGIAPERVPADRSGQRCRADGAAIRCELRRVAPGTGEPATPEAARRHLLGSVTVQSDSRRIRELAASIAGGEAEPAARIGRLLAWLADNLQKEAVDSFSALDVLETRRAECQGHSYLYAALARALDIPTRVVNGLVYSDEHGGFLYHTWAESVVGGRWQPVDPTLAQSAADATHLAIAEGENLAELVSLADWLGRARAEVLQVGYAGPHHPAALRR